MSIEHHIPEELLLDYASGSLSEGWSLVVATHLALCDSCRAQYERLERVGGLLMDDCDGDMDVDGSLFDRLLDRVDALPTEEPQSAPARAPVPHILPEPLRSRLGGDLHTLKWRRFGKGVFHIPLKTGDPSLRVRMLKVPAGLAVPEHGHKGQELTLVLAGEFSTQQGRFGRGDVEYADSSVDHQPHAGEGEDCICLAVTDAPLRFNSWPARLVQPFLGI